MQKGNLSASGSLSAGGASSKAALADNDKTWAWQVGGRAGTLNEGLSLGVDLAGGWSPNEKFGLWLKLDGEFSDDLVDHYQATLNLGYRPAKRWKLLGTLDFLRKTVEVASWGKDEMLTQYGAGLALSYLLSRQVDISGSYRHYRTDGEEYGRIREYEYIDSDNWQHYGFLYGAVRGGDYDELGLDATYHLPGVKMDIGLGVSQIWRNYEEMLGYDSKRMESAAGRINYTWRNVMNSGLTLKAGVSMEFSANDNLSWNLNLDKRIGPVFVGLTYSEYANDLAGNDRRLYLSLRLPLGAKPVFSRRSPAKGKQGKPTFNGHWVTRPVSGMGQPTLKVAEQLERRIDTSLVNLNEIRSGVSVNKNIMTISGLPVLTGMDSSLSTPASAYGAFSLGSGGTAVVVDLAKLPRPAYIFMVFNQEDGLYTLVTFNAEAGSCKITGQGHQSGLGRETVTVLANTSGIKDSGECYNPSKFEIAASGPTNISVGATATYNVKAMVGEIGSAWAGIGIPTKRINWTVTGDAEKVDSGEASVDIKALRPGSATIVVTAYDDSNNWGHYATKTIYVAITAKDTQQKEQTSAQLSEGSWVFSNGSTYSVQLIINSRGQASTVYTSRGTMTGLSSNLTYSATTVGGSVFGNVGGDAHNLQFNLYYNSNTGAYTGIITETVNSGSPNAYNVTGHH